MINHYYLLLTYSKLEANWMKLLHVTLNSVQQESSQPVEPGSEILICQVGARVDT